MSLTRKIKIALADLHNSVGGRHSVFMPLGIGLVGSYAISQIGEENVELRMFTEPNTLLDAIDTWKPDILGISNFCWNSEVAYLCFSQAKVIDPAILCVGGGPNFPNDQQEIKDFLEARPNIDLFIPFEGEVPFADIASRIHKGATLNNLKSERIPGVVSLHPENSDLVAGPKAQRLLDMDTIPSPYVTGLMDQWFDGNHAPMIETTRGCPFSCTFCVQGNKDWSNVARFGPEHIKQELDYIAEKMHAYPGVLLGIADANFAMYEQDEATASHLRHLQDTYNWPNAYDVTTGKAQYDRIRKIADLLQGKMKITASQQSLNSATLKAIKRKNISMGLYEELQRQIKEQGMRSGVEVIVPLPEETIDTFFAGIQELLKAGAESPIVYTTMMLKGSSLSSPETRENYEFQTKYRIIPRQFGEYRGERCFEVEEVCVATKHLCFEEYLDCRGFGLIASTFTAGQFDILRRHLNELNIQFFDYIYRTWDLIAHSDTPLTQTYKEFLAATSAELFESEEELNAFYSMEENYQMLLSGEIGDNLLRKHRTKFLVMQCEEVFDFLYSILLEMLSEKDATIWNDALIAARDWIKSIRNIGDAFLDANKYKSEAYIDLDFDVMSWYEGSEEFGNLIEYKSPAQYKISVNAKKVDKILNDQIQLYGGNPAFIAGKFLTNWPEKTLWRDCSYSQTNPQ